MRRHLHRKKLARHYVTGQVDARHLHPDEEAGISRSCFWHLIGLQLSISENKNQEMALTINHMFKK